MGFIASPVKCIPNVMAIEFLQLYIWWTKNCNDNGQP